MKRILLSVWLVASPMVPVFSGITMKDVSGTNCPEEMNRMLLKFYFEQQEQKDSNGGGDWAFLNQKKPGFEVTSHANYITCALFAAQEFVDIKSSFYDVDFQEFVDQKSSFYDVTFQEWSERANETGMFNIDSLTGALHWAAWLDCKKDKIECDTRGNWVNKSLNIMLSSKGYSYSAVKRYPFLKSADFKKMHEEAVACLAGQYEIILHVKPEYFVFLSIDLFRWLLKAVLEKDEFLSHIASIKIKCNPLAKDPNPLLVICSRYLPGNKEAKANILNHLVDAVVKRYEYVVEKIADKNSTPLWSKRINDLVWVAGGNLRGKLAFLDFCGVKETKNTTLFPRHFYTKSGCFIKGYDFDYKALPKEEIIEKKDEKQEKKQDTKKREAVTRLYHP